jgi:hypothetical protein
MLPARPAAMHPAFDAAGHGDRWPRSSLLWSPVSQRSLD